MPTNESLPKRIVLMCSKNRRDIELLHDLAIYIEPLRSNGVIDTWHVGLTQPGQSISEALDNEFAHADAIVLLLSPHILADDLRMSRIEQAKNRGVQIVPVLLWHCLYRETIVGDMDVLSAGGTPVGKAADIGAAWDNVAVKLGAKLARSTTANGAGDDKLYERYRRIKVPYKPSQWAIGVAFVGAPVASIPLGKWLMNSRFPVVVQAIGATFFHLGALIALFVIGGTMLKVMEQPCARRFYDGPGGKGIVGLLVLSALGTTINFAIDKSGQPNLWDSIIIGGKLFGVGFLLLLVTGLALGILCRAYHEHAISISGRFQRVSVPPPKK